MKRLIGLIVVVAGLWAGYWWVGITGLRSGIAQGLEISQAHVTVADWRAQGFPSRFDIEISGAELHGQDWHWQIPKAEVMAMAWAPSKLIVWAGVPQTLTLYGQDFPITANDMRANVDFGLSADAPLQKLVAVMDAPQIGDLRADQTRLALQQIGDAPQYRIGGAITALNGADIGWDAEIALPARIDRAMINLGLPRPQTIDLKSFSIKTGGAEMIASGALTVTEQGYLDGPLTLEVTNPDALIAALKREDFLPNDQIKLLENMLRAIRGQDGRTVLPVTFARGQTIVAGFIPVGPAPRLP
jgi:hypothetical protein